MKKTTKKFKFYIENNEQQKNLLITVEAADRQLALTKICNLMSEEPYLRDLIKMAVGMEVVEV